MRAVTRHMAGGSAVERGSGVGGGASSWGEGRAAAAVEGRRCNSGCGVIVRARSQPPPYLAKSTYL
jgi:hypothetical protein